MSTWKPMMTCTKLILTLEIQLYLYFQVKRILKYSFHFQWEYYELYPRFSFVISCDPMHNKFQVYNVSLLKLIGWLTISEYVTNICNKYVDTFEIQIPHLVHDRLHIYDPSCNHLWLYLQEFYLKFVELGNWKSKIRK